MSAAALPRIDLESDLATRFRLVARAQPERLAVADGARRLSYGRLLEAADRVAAAVVASGAPEDVPVAVLGPTDARLVSALLGVLGASRFYVPLDPAVGEARLEAAARLSRAALVLAAGGLEPAARRLFPGARVLDLDAVLAGTAAPLAEGRPNPGAPAYVLFTSGSTGAPKGVVQSHRNVLQNVRRLGDGLRLGPEDRMSLVMPASFGASVSDVFGALLHGASLHVLAAREHPPAAWRDWARHEGLTIWHSVPGLFRVLARAVEERGALPDLRLVKLGGEPVLARDLDVFRRLFGRGVFHVGLGMTEMNVVRQWFATDDFVAASTVLPVGGAVEDAEVRLLGPDGREVAPGCEGEIAILSATLATGYWDRPEETARAFEALPDGRRLFRTGDLGRLDAGGCLHHLGRSDDLVKVRGERVVLGAVQAALLEQPAVREAFAAPRVTARAGTEVSAWIVADRADPAALARALRAVLPSAAVPTAWAFVDALPRLPNGKVDRAALPEPGPLVAARREPATPLESAIAGAFAEVLGHAPVGADDDFFDLGGSSLLALDVALLVERRTRLAVEPAFLAAAPTPRRLAAMLAPGGAETTVVRLGAAEAPEEILVVPAAGGAGEDLFAEAYLAAALTPDAALAALRLSPPGDLDPARLLETCAALLRARRPHGPYALVGSCVGGRLAWATAARLASEGETVRLVLLDSPAGEIEPGLRFRGRIGLDVGRRARHHLARLRGLDARRAPAYVRGLLDAVRRWLARVLSPSFHRVKARQDAFKRTVAALSLAPAPIPTLLVLSASSASRGRGEAWAAIASDLRVLTFPGGHDTYLRRHLPEIAEAIRAFLLFRGEGPQAAASRSRSWSA